jgi:CRP-like cAMP-binding protein
VAKPSRELIKGVGLFSELDDSAADTLASDFIERYFNAGDVIATEGESGLNFFVVEEGEAVVSIGGDEVGRLGPGDAFGEIALVDKSARSATVTAATAMHCHALPVWSFRSFTMSHPDVAWKLLELLAERVRYASARSSE